MAPWNNRTCQSSGVFGKAIRDLLVEEEILLKDVMITRGEALALTDQRLIHLSMRTNFIKRSIRVQQISIKEIHGLEIDDLCPHYINGTRPSGFKLRILDFIGRPSGEWFGENDAIDTMLQLILELQHQLYLLSDRDLVEVSWGQSASDLPDELGRKVSFMLEPDECIVHELMGKNGRALCITNKRVILLRADREASHTWGRQSVIELPFSRLDRILTSSEIVNPQIVMNMAVYFEVFGKPLPGGKAEHLSVLGSHWTEMLQALLVANSMKQSRHSSYVTGLSGLS